MTDFQVDFKDAITSLTLLKLTRVFREMKPEQTLEIYGVDGEARADIFKVLPAEDYQVIVVDRQDDASYRIELKKR